MELWDTHEFEFRVPNDANDRIDLASRGGMVICCHEKQNSKPVVHQKALPPEPPDKAAPKNEPAPEQ